MELGRFAAAVGASPRWVLNALTRLKVPRRYSEPLARRLALAREISMTVQVPLPEAFGIAGQALKEVDPRGVWRLGAAQGVVDLSISMERFLASYLPRLSLAMTHYGEKQRGRRASRRRSATVRAQEYGIDTSLLRAQLTRTPAQRLSDLDANLEFLRNAKVGR